MINIIKHLLVHNKEVSDWIITEDETFSAELFFVKDKLDINRETKTKEFNVKVFTDNDINGIKYRGDASFEFGISDDIEEIKEKLNLAIYSSKFVKNKWYPLPENDNNSFRKLNSYNTIDDLKKNFKEIHEALFKDYKYESKVNSCEVFSTVKNRHLITSKNVDAAYQISEFTFEIVTDCNMGVEPVEIFNGYYLNKIDIKEIEKIVDKQLMETEGRSKAVRSELMENKRVILTGDAVEELLEFYVLQASDSMIYQQVSKARLNEDFQNNPLQRLNITLNPFLSFSTSSRVIDGEGKKLESYILYKDGIVKNIRTQARYSYYLNIENKGMVRTFEVEGGNTSIEEFKKDDYIEILTFSSFLMDPITGDFGGEFRLAKKVENGKEEYITGGAIALNIFEQQNQMIFSKELENRKISVAPKAIIFDNITIS